MCSIIFDRHRQFRFTVNFSVFYHKFPACAVQQIALRRCCLLIVPDTVQKSRQLNFSICIRLFCLIKTSIFRPDMKGCSLKHFSVSLTYFLQNKTVLPVCKRHCDLCVLFPDRYFLFRRIQHISIWSRRFPHKIRSVLQPVFERLSIFIRFQHSCYRLIRKQHCSVYRCNCSARNHLICCTRKCFP